MFNKNQTDRIIQLEDEVRSLKVQLEQAEQKNKILMQKTDATFEAKCQEQLEEKTSELTKNREDLEFLVNECTLKLETANRRNEAEDAIQRSHQTMHKILNYINAYIFVADFETLKILYVNDNLQNLVGGELIGKECWKVLQVGQCEQCSYCPQRHLLDKEKYPKGLFRFDNPFEWTKFNQFLLVDAMVIEWTDGRKALLEVLFDITDRKLIEKELVVERDRLQAIGDNFPNGSLFRLEVNPQNMKMYFSYVSATWEKVMGISIEETMTDASKVFDMVLPEFAKMRTEAIKESTLSLQHYYIEYQKWHKGNEIKWVQISSYPHKISEDKVVFDGFVLDITARKEADIELAKYREKLECIVKERTEELQVANEELQVNNEELQAINEELHATSEELYATNEELYATNEELEKYKMHLEEMVDEKTKEVILRQNELEKLNRRQEVFIKVLQILQLEEDVSKGMNIALDIIGHYIRVDRVQVWEDNTDGITYGCSYIVIYPRK